MELVIINTLMGMSMKASGLRTKDTARVNTFLHRNLTPALCSAGLGSMARLTALVVLPMLIATNIKATGLMTLCKGLESIFSTLGLSNMESTCQLNRILASQRMTKLRIRVSLL